MISSLDPSDIIPLHPAWQEGFLKELVADMEENGWQGRPLLVVNRDGEFRALTGSHRIEAARRAGIEDLPCYVVDGSRFDRHEIDVFWCVLDHERLEAVQTIGDEEALLLMEEELRN